MPEPDFLPPRVGRRVRPPNNGVAGSRGEGLSGFVPIAGSRISLHTLPERRFVNADVFWCEDFDVEDALHVLQEALLPRRVEGILLDRGLEFPKHLARSRDWVVRDRRAIARSLGLEASR